MSYGYCVHGYGTGCSRGDPYRDPHLFSYNTDYAVAYDLETNFLRRGEFHVSSPILCSSLVRTCGRSLLITRSKLHSDKVKQLVLGSSQEIVIATIHIKIKHTPAFSMGHNIYSCDNTILEFSFSRNHPYIRSFNSTNKSYTNKVPSI